MATLQMEVQQFLRLHDKFEKGIIKDIVRSKNRLINDAVESFKEGGGAIDWARVTTGHLASIKNILENGWEKIIPAFGKNAVDGYLESKSLTKQQDDDFFATLIRNYIAAEAGRSINIVATAQADVMRAIAIGVKEAEGIEQIAKRITGLKAGINPHRARVIARTEVHDAATFSALQSVKDEAQALGATVTKKWVPVLDARTRDDHRAMFSKKPIDVNDLFTVGGEKALRPGDPNLSAKQRVNCRCAVVFRDKEFDFFN